MVLVSGGEVWMGGAPVLVGVCIGLVSGGSVD